MNEQFYLYIHKLVPKKDQYQDPQLAPKIVIRRSLELPVVMAVFRRNAMQHVRFFHEFMGQSVSYAKMANRGQEKYELSPQFIKRVKPLFAQLCDPYTSYNQGQYGVTLKQVCFQSILFFGQPAPYFGQRLFHYLIMKQHKTLVMLHGGEHRFKKVITPKDHIQY